MHLDPLEPLRGAGGVLFFLRQNIEIADHVTALGSRFITFQFGGNFARDIAFLVGNWHLAKITACPLCCLQSAGGYLAEAAYSRSGMVGKHFPDRSTYRRRAHHLRRIILLSKIPAEEIGFRL